MDQHQAFSGNRVETKQNVVICKRDLSIVTKHVLHNTIQYNTIQLSFLVVISRRELLVANILFFFLVFLGC